MEPEDPRKACVQKWNCPGCENLSEVLRALLLMQHHGGACNEFSKGCSASSKWETIARNPHNTAIGMFYCDDHIDDQPAKEHSRAPHLRVIERFLGTIK